MAESTKDTPGVYGKTGKVRIMLGIIRIIRLIPQEVMIIGWGLI